MFEIKDEEFWTGFRKFSSRSKNIRREDRLLSALRRMNICMIPWHYYTGDEKNLCATTVKEQVELAYRTKFWKYDNVVRRRSYSSAVYTEKKKKSQLNPSGSF